MLFSLKQTYLNGELYSGDLAKYSSSACWVHQDIPPGTTVQFDARHGKGISFQVKLKCSKKLIFLNNTTPPPKTAKIYFLTEHFSIYPKTQIQEY